MEAEILNEGYYNDPRKNIHHIYFKEMIINPFIFNNPNAEIEIGIVAFVPLDGSQTDIIQDIPLSGTVEYTAGLHGSLCGIFDGANSLMSVFPGNLPKLAEPRTLNAWFNGSEPPSGLRSLFGYGGSSTLEKFMISSGYGVNRLFGWLGDNNMGTASPIPNGWNMVTMSYDGDVVKMYLNSILLNSLTVVLKTKNYSLSIGVGAPYDNWIGLIQDCGVWNRCLTDTEIIKLYNNGSGLKLFI